MKKRIADGGGDLPKLREKIRRIIDQSPQELEAGKLAFNRQVDLPQEIKKRRDHITKWKSEGRAGNLSRTENEIETLQWLRDNGKSVLLDRKTCIVLLDSAEVRSVIRPVKNYELMISDAKDSLQDSFSSDLSTDRYFCPDRFKASVAMLTKFGEILDQAALPENMRRAVVEHNSGTGTVREIVERYDLSETDFRRKAGHLLIRRKPGRKKSK